MSMFADKGKFAGSGAGTAWLIPFVNGAPPIGWGEASKYLVLPVLLVIAQFASSAIISPVNKDDVSSTLSLPVIQCF